MPAKTKKAAVPAAPKPLVKASEFDNFFKTMYLLPTKEAADAYFAAHELEQQGNLPHLMECIGKYRHNFDKPNQKGSNLALAQRYHNLLLTRLVLRQDASGTKATFSETQSTFSAYEQKAKDMDSGSVSDEEIAYLDSLPAVGDEWNNHTFTLNEICTYYFPEEVGAIVTSVTPKTPAEIELDALLDYEIDTYKQENRAELRSLRQQIFNLMLRKHGNREDAIAAFKLSL